MWKRRTLLVYQQLVCARQLSSSSQPVIAIRREDQSVWERRAALAPSQVKQLVNDGVKVLVQPSNRRAFPMKAYTDVGAVIQEDLREASLILGVKQVPIDSLIPQKTYAFFSHTIKAQEANMPLLDAILEKDIRIIDYEKMVDDGGMRLVAFGKYAGVAGMINTLHGLGLRLLALGHHTPFMHIGPAHNYRNSEMARQAIRDAGYEISLGMLPQSMGPLTFVFTGTGNVSQGAQEVFQELPFEYIPPSQLANVAVKGSSTKCYACVIDKHDHLVNKYGGPFDEGEFGQHPDRYISTFSQRIAPYASVIVNGIFYKFEDPRLISIPDAKRLLQPENQPWIPSSEGCPHLPHRLLSICDISADPGGSIEFMKECTTIDKPFCLYDAEQNTDTESFNGEGVLVCSIDNMPTQLPREATEYFGGRLMPFVHDMIKSDASTPFSELDCSRVVKDAVIASNGSLTPNYEYIAEMRKKSKSRHKVSVTASGMPQKRVTIMGAGYVSEPVIEYLLRSKDVCLTVASQFQHEVDKMAAKYNVDPILMDIQRRPDDADKLVERSDLVISLLPFVYHPLVAKMCIDHGVNMATASYISPEMKELDEAARQAGITIMNEIGVDPGIDHMLAMDCFDDIRKLGGTVTSFVSYCGGLPAPECSANPLRYKFSWSPVGVIGNLTSAAKYLHNGQVIEVPSGGQLMNVYEKKDFLPGFNLEGFPNRDSLVYGPLYGIESAKTLLRGTLRYAGFCENVKALLELGLTSREDHHLLHPGGPDITWKQFLCELVGKPTDTLTDILKLVLHERFGGDASKVDVIEQLGLLNDDDFIEKEGSPLLTTSKFLNKKLAFGQGERDLIILRHDVGIRWMSGEEQERHIDMVVYGDADGYSAMAKTVGYPTGIGAKMILDGEIQSKGVLGPYAKEVYGTMLKRLAQEGIIASEHTVDK